MFDPRFQAVDATGKPYSGARLFFYRGGTTSLIPIYKNSDATTPHANPVVANTSGAFPAIFIASANPFKIILKTAAGVTLDTIDRIPVGEVIDIETLGQIVDQASDEADRAVAAAGAAAGSAAEAAGYAAGLNLPEIATGDAGKQLVVNEEEDGYDLRSSSGGSGAVETRAALKALNTSAATSIYLAEPGREGQFIWRSGDYAARIAADVQEGVYIKANAVAATVGAWVRQGSWAVDGISATWFGVVSNDTSKGAVNGTAIDAAFLFGSTYKVPVNLPAGTITCSFSRAVPILGYSDSPCVAKLYSNLVVRGAGIDLTILRLANGQSATTTYNWNFFTGNTVLQNIQFYDLTFDLNGANNPISPNRSIFYTADIFNGTPGFIRCTTNHAFSIGDEVRFHRTSQTQTLMPPIVSGTTYYVVAVPNTVDIRVSATPGGAPLDVTLGGTNPVTVEKVGVFGTVNSAAIMVSGTVSVVGDARLEGGKFERIKVVNTPGYSCFVFGGGSTVSATRGKDIEVSSCVFYNSGTDADDHSCIFALANNVNVHDCIFDHPTQSKGIFGPAVAVELHGSNNKFNNNYVNNFMQALWITGSAVGEVRDIQVHGNTIKVNVWAIATWTIPPENNGLFGLSIKDNVIEINSGIVWDQGGSASYGAGVVLSNTSGTLGRAIVEGNIIRAIGAQRNNHGIVVSAGGSGYIIDVDILGNQLTGFGSGILVANATSSAFNVNIRNNNVNGVIANISFPVGITRGISINGNHGSVSIQNNSVTGPVAYGVRLDGTLDNLTMDGNRFLSATAGISDACTVVSTGRRVGKQAFDKFTSAPAEAYWDVGDFVPMKPGALTMTGAAPNRVVITGWMRMVAGTAVGASTVGTHWAQIIEELAV